MNRIIILFIYFNAYKCTLNLETFSELSEERYWKDFYEKKNLETIKKPFEWLLRYADVKHLLKNHDNKLCLDVGCGISNFISGIFILYNIYIIVTKSPMPRVFYILYIYIYIYI